MENIFTQTEIKSYSQDAVLLLQDLIKIPSVSKNEQNIRDMLMGKMLDKGFFPTAAHNNVVVPGKSYSQQRKDLVFLSHIDTVPDSASWSKDPFLPALEDGKLYGLGSNDAGAAVVCLFTVFEQLDRMDQISPLPFNVKFIAAAEEEISGQHGVSSIISEFKNAELVVVGEPTSMNIACAEKGLIVVDCIAKGLSGHAARGEGVNAIDIALSDIAWLHRYTDPKPSDLLGPLKMTATVIEAGTVHNVVPDQCKFTVDIRVTDKWTTTEVLELLERNLASSATPRSTRLTASSLPLDNEFWQVISAFELKPYGSPTMSDQALLRNIASFKCSPGNSNRSHTADEFIFVDEIEQGIEKFGRLFSKYIKIKQSNQTE